MTYAYPLCTHLCSIQYMDIYSMISKIMMSMQTSPDSMTSNMSKYTHMTGTCLRGRHKGLPYDVRLSIMYRNSVYQYMECMEQMYMHLVMHGIHHDGYPLHDVVCISTSLCTYTTTLCMHAYVYISLMEDSRDIYTLRNAMHIMSSR